MARRASDDATRPRCKVSGCGEPATLKQVGADGVREFRAWCYAHGNRVGSSNGGTTRSTGEPCDRCGWNEAPCDRHRVVANQGYTDENVVVLCPNCHREIHFWGEHLLGLQGEGA
jgi:hypothetical protein